MPHTPTARVEKPWGHELIWARTDRYVGKILHIKAGHALSLQYHQVKDETVHVLAGQMRFVFGASESAMTEQVARSRTLAGRPMTSPGTSTLMIWRLPLRSTL